MKSSKDTPVFRLLPYQILAKHWLGPAMWLIPSGLIFWWVIPNFSQLDQRYTLTGLIISGISTLIAFYTLLARRAHDRSNRNNFVIRGPLYPVAFSYQRVEMVRPVEFKSIFPPQTERTARWRFYKDIWGKTVIVVSLKGYPIPLWWMRLWLHPYLLHPKETAVVLPVDDWMRLSRNMETLRTTWREAQRRHREK